MHPTEHRTIDIVMMPDYLIPTLEAHGYTLEYLDRKSGKNNIEHLSKELPDRMSSNDLADLAIANNISAELGITNIYVKTNSSKFDFIEHYKDKNIDMLSIILSKNKNEYKKVFDIVKTDGTLFIVLHKGFTNYVFHKNAFREYISRIIIDTVFDTYGEDVLVNSTVFKSFTSILD